MNALGESQSRILRKVQTNALRNLAFVEVAKDSIPHHGLQLSQIASLGGNPATARVIPRGAVSAVLVFSHLKNDLAHKFPLNEERRRRKRPLISGRRLSPRPVEVKPWHVEVKLFHRLLHQVPWPVKVKLLPLGLWS